MTRDFVRSDDQQHGPIPKGAEVTHRKYVVFKTTDTEYARPVADAVVIRKQDIFAGPALEMYAKAIWVAIHVLPNDDPNRGRLMEIADYFHESATDAYEMAGKIPD